MAKFLKINTAGGTEEEAFATSSSGVGDAGKGVALNAQGQIDETMIPGAEVKSIVASETLAAGELVNVFDDAGTPKMRKADASNEGKKADGFVLSNVTSGASGKFHGEGIISGLSSLTIGARYFLSATTPGAITTTPPTTAGHILQEVGKAISATELVFEAQTPIKRA
jgi:hypothetical protein